MQYMSFSVWLISLSIMSIQVLTNGTNCFFFYGWIIIVLCICLICVCVCVCVCARACMPCCLIYSSKRWHLWCFHSLAIKIIIQWTWGCRYVFPISLHFLQKNTQKWNCWVFTFSEASRLFSRVVAPINKHTNSEHMFPFLHILSIFVICVLFDDSHSDWHEVVFGCSPGLHSPDD